jgi:hypothetical protein
MTHLESVKTMKKKHPKQVGMSCKNTRFIKKGLTWEEIERVEKATNADKSRWEYLLAKPLNKWTPQKS